MAEGLRVLAALPEVWSSGYLTTYSSSQILGAKAPKEPAYTRVHFHIHMDKSFIKIGNLMVKENLV